MDWSTGTITKKFEEVGLVSTPELNRVYRQMLVSTPGIEKYISGVILHDQTIHQNLDSGESFPEFLAKKGILPGARGDTGGEKWMETDQKMSSGLEGLTERLEGYVKKGIKFSKWRAGFKITDNYPTKEFLEESLSRKCLRQILQQESYVYITIVLAQSYACSVFSEKSPLPRRLPSCHQPHRR